MRRRWCDSAAFTIALSPTLTMQSPPIARFANRKARILTVDDDRTTLAMLSIAIRKAGYDILQASSAEEALDMIAENQPDLAVLDISMPGMSGIELAQRLRDETAIPFMFLSSHTETEIVRRAAGQGAIGYLLKPLDFAQVAPVIDAGLARTQAQRQLQDADLIEHRRREADLMGRYAELAELEMRLQHTRRQSLLNEKSAARMSGADEVISLAHAEIKTLEADIHRLSCILDAYQDSHASAAADNLAREELVKISSKLVLALLRRDPAILLAQYREANRRVCEIVRILKNISLAHGSDQWLYSNLHPILDSAIAAARSRTGLMAPVRKEYKEYTGPAEIECLPVQIGQVFMHLIDNAIRATAGKSQAEVIVRSGVAGERAWIEISDNGCGVAPENRQLIFQPFFTTRPIGTSLGLGLSICSDIAQHHGGDIQVAGRTGEGSTFRVSLLLRQAQQGQQGAR
jgi:two-component system NtrC family sensor kinase